MTSFARAQYCRNFLFNHLRDINKIGDGIGAKFGRIICSLIGFFVGYIIGFVYCWRLAFVMLAQLPLLFLCGGMMATVSSYLRIIDCSLFHRDNLYQTELCVYEHLGHI